MNNKGLLVILSAPSGCGKDTVFKKLCSKRNDCVESISATTRKPREGEEEGVNYFFKTEKEFEELIDNHGLLEYARYNNSYYGTPVAGVEKAIKDGKICFLIIDVQGAKNIMKMRPDSVSIFLLPPSIEILEKRLNNRQTNDPEDIKRRMELARDEIANSSLYKYNVVNDDLDVAVNEISRILDNELKNK